MTAPAATQWLPSGYPVATQSLPSGGGKPKPKPKPKPKTRADMTVTVTVTVTVAVTMTEKHRELTGRGVLPYTKLTDLVSLLREIKRKVTLWN